MADDSEKRRVAKFAETIHSVKHWLENEFSGKGFPAEVELHVAKLKLYLNHCARRIKAGDNGALTIERRRQKIQDSVIFLWGFGQGRKR